MLPERERRTGRPHLGNGAKALALTGLLTFAWSVALTRSGSVAPSVSGSAVSFQPVPNTSPVPTDFLQRSTSRPAMLPSSSAPPDPSALQAMGSSFAPAAPASSRTEFEVFQSQAVGRPMHYLVYEPAAYQAQPTERFATLYLLHGIGAGFGGASGFETEWPGYGALSAADDLIGSGAIQPLLIVMPGGEQGYWMDWANDGPAYGRYVTDDLVSEIDGRFRTLPVRSSRAIGGLSMGGFGALSLAMRRPDVFGTAGAHSPSLPRRDQGPDFFGDTTYFAAHDPVQLLRDHPNIARTLNLWLDVSMDDPQWRTSVEALHQQLTNEAIPHSWHEWAGGHDGVYWNAHMNEYLAFYNTALKAFATQPEPAPLTPAE